MTHEPFHSLADRRSWALHREVARRLRDQPELVDRARRRVAQWQERPTRHPYANAWRDLLERPLEDLCSALVSTSTDMTTLRQASPFAGAIDSRARWRLLKSPDLTEREKS